MSDDCLFCKIVRGEIPSATVADGDAWIAFNDIHPKAPVHILIVPKRHIATLSDAAPDDRALLGELLLAASTVAKTVGISESGYKVAINVGKAGGQEVFHLHVHVLGGL